MAGNAEKKPYVKGMLREVVRQRMAEIAEKRKNTANIEFADDPAVGMEAYHTQNDMLYIESQIEKALDQQFGALNGFQREVMYNMSLSKEQREKYPVEQFYKDLSEKRFDRVYQNLGGIEDAASALELVLDEKAGAELSERIGSIVSPRHPDFPKEELSTHPEQERIEALKAQIKPDDPQAAEKKALLDRVNESLSYAKPDVVNYANRLDSGFENTRLKGMTQEMDYINSGIGMRKFLEKYETTVTKNGKSVKVKGALVDKFPKHPSGNYNPGGVFYGKCAISQEDFRQFRQEKPKLSEDLKKKVSAITNKMDDIGKERFENASTATKDNDGKTVFLAEQGEKNYAFWPYVTAKMHLRKMVQEGDLENIRKAQEDFDRVREQTDAMLEATRGGQATFSGNVNSTRPEPGRTEPNQLPPSYLMDYTAQNQLNGTFMLYAFCKNEDVTVEQVLDDPVGTLASITEKKVQASAEAAKAKPVATQLVRMLSERCIGLDIDGGTGHNPYLFGRGLDSVSGMAPSDEERERLVGIGNLALIVSENIVEQEKHLWNVAEFGAEKRHAFFAQALLDPEFVPRSAAEALNKPDWKKTHNVETMLSDLRAQGKLDMGSLAERTKTILDGTRAAMKELKKEGLDTNFNTPDFLEAATRVARTALLKATDQEKQSEGYQQLAQSLTTMEKSQYEALVNATPVVEDAMTMMDREIAILKAPKKGLFLSSKNSPEHERMTKELTVLQNKLRMLQGDESGLSEKEKSELEKVSLADQIRNARAATYNYCRLKSNNGNKVSFFHDVGTERYNAADRVISCLDNIADNFSMRTPAEKLIQNTQRTFLDKRSDSEWMRENGELAASKMIYAKMIANEGRSEEMEEDLLRERLVNAKAEKIMQDEKGFKKLLGKEGLDKIADRAVQGSDELIRGIGEAMNAPEKTTRQVEIKTPTVQKDRSLDG